MMLRTCSTHRCAILAGMLVLAMLDSATSFLARPPHRTPCSLSTNFRTQLESLAEQDTIALPYNNTFSPPIEPPSVLEAKQAVVEMLSSGQAEENSPALEPYLAIMKESYKNSGIDARFSASPSYNGIWSNLNHPNFPGRLGLNPKNGRPSYTIGTLTFGNIPDVRKVAVEIEKMTPNVNFLDAVQQDFPSIEQIPANLRDSVLSHPEQLRSNNLDTHFEIPGTDVKGIIRTESFVFPNPDNPNGFDTWFVGGSCFAKPGVDSEAWNAVFRPKAAHQEASESEDRDEHMTSDGETSQDLEKKLRYSLPNPMSAYQTVVYLDEDIRVTVGHRGSVMIVRREAE